jgi:hypothetical protein
MDSIHLRLNELEGRERSSSQREAQARKIALDVTLAYEGGLRRAEARITLNMSYIFLFPSNAYSNEYTCLQVQAIED